MSMLCEKCGKQIAVANGEYVYYQDTMLFACKDCARRMNDEMKCVRKVCAAVDGKKTQAERIIQDKDAYAKFLHDIGTTWKKVPNIGSLRSDIPLLVSLVKRYMSGEFTDISYNTIIAAVVTLQYVISPIDIIPDMIPVIGYTDDAMAVSLCMKMIQNDLENYKRWLEQLGGIV